jgi:hypothetical protein
MKVRILERGLPGRSALVCTTASVGFWGGRQSGGCCGLEGRAPVRSAGFTLIELVISAGLMSMILVSAYLCLRSGVLSQKLIESREEVFQNARVAMALISADLRSSCTLSKEFEFLGMDRMLGDIEADNLDFGTLNYSPRRPYEGDFCEVSYFLGKDPQTGTLSLWRRRDPTPDPDPLSGGNREEIARGLKGLKFEYYDGFDWYDEWGDPLGKRKGQQTSLLDPPNMVGMPEAVRITLWFDSNPRSKPKSAQSTETDSEDPPVVLQTVARLNLATLSLPSSSTSSTSSGGSPNSSAGNPAGGPANVPPN